MPRQGVEEMQGQDGVVPAWNKAEFLSLDLGIAGLWITPQNRAEKPPAARADKG